MKQHEDEIIEMHFGSLLKCGGGGGTNRILCVKRRSSRLDMTAPGLTRSAQKKQPTSFNIYRAGIFDIYLIIGTIYLNWSYLCTRRRG